MEIFATVLSSGDFYKGQIIDSLLNWSVLTKCTNDISGLFTIPSAFCLPLASIYSSQGINQISVVPFYFFNHCYAWEQTSPLACFLTSPSRILLFIT